MSIEELILQVRGQKGAQQPTSGIRKQSEFGELVWLLLAVFSEVVCWLLDSELAIRERQKI